MTPRVLQPARPQLAAALACVLGGDEIAALEIARRPGAMAASLAALADPGLPSPAEAWEALAARGVVPLDWVDDPRRVFEAPGYVACGACGGDGLGSSYDNDWTDAPACGACHGKGTQWSIRRTQSHPETVAACVALASDVRGVLTAERLAREAVARLAPWGAPQPQRVVWRVVDPKTWQAPDWRGERSEYGWDFLVAASHATRSAPFDSEPRWATRAITHESHAVRSYARMAREAADWDFGQQIDAVVNTTARSDRHGGKPLREFANPWQPLVELFDLGYALDALIDDAVVLVAPSLEAA